MLISYLFSEPLVFVAVVVAALIALTVHEFSHAAMALYFGDDTAQKMGRLSLNPVVHIDPIGFLLVLFVGFGWAKPVPVNPYNLKNHKLAPALISAAGPLSNLLLAIVAGGFLKIISPYLGPSNLAVNFLFVLMLISVALLVFNLIPIPPLDGSKVLFSILPDRFNDFKYKLSINGPWILLGFLILDNVLNLHIFSTFFGWIFEIIAKFL